MWRLEFNRSVICELACSAVMRLIQAGSFVKRTYSCNCGSLIHCLSEESDLSSVHHCLPIDDCVEVLLWSKDVAMPCHAFGTTNSSRQTKEHSQSTWIATDPRSIWSKRVSVRPAWPPSPPRTPSKPLPRLEMFQTVFLYTNLKDSKHYHWGQINRQP